MASDTSSPELPTQTVPTRGAPQQTLSERYHHVQIAIANGYDRLANDAALIASPPQREATEAHLEGLKHEAALIRELLDREEREKERSTVRRTQTIMLAISGLSTLAAVASAMASLFNAWK